MVKGNTAVGVLVDEVTAILYRKFCIVYSIVDPEFMVGEATTMLKVPAESMRIPERVIVPLSVEDVTVPYRTPVVGERDRVTGTG